MITTHAEAVTAAHGIRTTGHGLLRSQVRALDAMLNLIAAQEALVGELQREKEELREQTARYYEMWKGAEDRGEALEEELAKLFKREEITK